MTHKSDHRQDYIHPHDLSPCLEFRHVWFAYGAETAIQDVTFQVRHGEFAAVLGPNGSGKTTLLKLALGLVKAVRGEVLLFGTPAGRFIQWGKVGYVPQTVDGVASQYPATATEVVAHGLYRSFDPAALFRRRARQQVVEALTTVGIADLGNKKLATLSAGQRQRALLARALVRQPDLLVLDEPVAGVDAPAEEQFYSLLRRLNRERGITILMVSHDIGAVMREATTVACINRTLVFHGPAHAITQRELSALYGIPMDVLVHDLLHEHR